MLNLIEPNIHPILVHFAFALSVTAAALYLAGSIGPFKRWHDTIAPAADWLLALGAVAIVATIAAGFQAYYTVDHDTPSHEVMTTHRNWAVPTGIAVILLAAWRWRTRAAAASALFTGLMALAALSLTVTAWWGGKAVYGYGLGVASLPTVTGDGHDHDHGTPAKIVDTVMDAAHSDAGAAPHGHDEGSGHSETAMPAAHDDAGSGPHSHAAPASNVPAGHDNSDGHHDTDVSATALMPAMEGSPAEIADAFLAALQSGDKARVEALFMPDVVLAEGGGAERSFADYAGHHMPSDMAYIGAMDMRIINRDIIENGDIATVITETDLQGDYKGQQIHNRSMETMVLKRAGNGWKIAHIHWSSAPATEDHKNQKRSEEAK